LAVPGDDDEVDVELREGVVPEVRLEPGNLPLAREGPEVEEGVAGLRGDRVARMRQVVDEPDVGDPLGEGPCLDVDRPGAQVAARLPAGRGDLLRERLRPSEAEDHVAVASGPLVAHGPLLEGPADVLGVADREARRALLRSRLAGAEEEGDRAQDPEER